MGGGGEESPPALPAPSPPPNSNAAPVIEAKAEPATEQAKPAKATRKPAKRIATLDVAKPLTPIKPVTLREELDDDIPVL
jgi:hypothetical protein